jgi:hypothetical protein
MKFVNLCLLAVCVSLYSCKKNDAPAEPTTPGEETGTTVRTRVQGIVNPGGPLPGAVVTLGGKTTTTNSMGVFYFDDIEISAEDALITATSTAYAQGAGSHTFSVANKDAIQYVEISLPTIFPEFNQTFDAATGGSLRTIYGPRIVFEPNQMLKSDNTPYSGTVTVNCYEDAMYENNYYSGTRYDQQFGAGLLGSHTGFNKAGKKVGILNKRVIGFTIKGSSGEALHIDTANGRSVQVFVNSKAPGSDVVTPQKGNPSQWYLNAAGKWQEEGALTTVGDSFVIKTKHPNVIGLTLSYDAVEIRGKLVDTINDRTWSNNIVSFMTKDENIVANVRTNSQGDFVAWVPANATLVMSVIGIQSSYGADLVNSIELTTGNAKINAGTMHLLAIDARDNFDIRGEVTGCDREQLKDGTILMTSADSLKNEFPITNGLYHAFVTGNRISEGSGKYTLAVKGKTPPFQFEYGYRFDKRDLNTCGLLLGKYYRYTFKNIQYMFKTGTDTLGLYISAGNPTGPYGLYVSSFGGGGNYVYWEFPHVFPQEKGSYTAPVNYYAPNYSGSYIGTMNYTINRIAPVGGYIEVTFKGLLTSENTPTDTATMQGDFRVILQ